MKRFALILIFLLGSSLAQTTIDLGNITISGLYVSASFFKNFADGKTDKQIFLYLSSSQYESMNNVFDKQRTIDLMNMIERSRLVLAKAKFTARQTNTTIGKVLLSFSVTTNKDSKYIWVYGNNGVDEVSAMLTEKHLLTFKKFIYQAYLEFSR